MALVLRKALVPKNVSLFKFVRGRPMATSQKKNPAPASQAALSRNLKDEKVMPLGRRRFSRTKHLFKSQYQRGGGSRSHDVRFCVSCPDLVPESRAKTHVSVRHFSPPRFRLIFKDPSYMKSSPVLFCIRSSLTDLTSKRPYSKCPEPCGPSGGPCGCACLPPPCNVPPRCIQYMTGYYYYPYGTWFCGPYHVTKPCCPVGPGGCGPCGPPCGGPCPCGPCCVCPDCCAAPAFASAVLSAAPKGNQCGTFPGNQITYTSKEFDRQPCSHSPQQSSQNQKPKHTHLTSSINFDKPIAPAGLKKVTPVAHATKFKNIATPRVVPPVMSSTYVTTSGSRFNGYGCRWSSRYMSSDVEKPSNPTSPAGQRRPFNSTRPSFQTYVAQVPLSHLKSASTPISAQTFTKAKHPYKLSSEYCSRGQTTIQNKGVTIAPYENTKIPTPPASIELEYYSSFKRYSSPACSVDWIFKKANADKLCPKYK